MTEFCNPEDQKIFECLDNFDFSGVPGAQGLKNELYLALVRALGYCSHCTAYARGTSRCSTLGVLTGGFERCSDFEPNETEEESAFAIMSKDFREEQERRLDLARIRKYHKMPRKPHKEVRPKRVKDESIS
jgi:hypothetical protein